MAQQQSKATFGQAFGAILTAIVAAAMFIPRLIGLADKAVSIADDVLDSGRNLSLTMKDTSEDYRTLSALERKAEFNQRLIELDMPNVSPEVKQQIQERVAKKQADLLDI